MHLHKTVLWWTFWGMVVGVGLFGLQESHRNSIHLIMAFPLLTGAAAAAALRLKHEYHEAMMHAKWLLFSAPLFLLGTGYMYAKAGAYGPFATASIHKAFMGTRFGMSVPEVERTVGRKLLAPNPSAEPSEGLRTQIMDLIARAEPAHEMRALPDLKLYGVPCKAQFEFVGGKLGAVAVEFQPTRREESAELMDHIQHDMDKDYKRADPPENAPAGSHAYQKEFVRAHVLRNTLESGHRQISVLLQYLPLAEKKSDLLVVEAQAF